MRYKSFRIRNFKGIKDTTINLDGIGGASVFVFVGLNESGKTTILEAIHSFSPDASTGDLQGRGKTAASQYNSYVPRHLISSFTGKVSVQATVTVSMEEKKEILSSLRKDENLECDISNFPNDVVFCRFQSFKDGDFVESQIILETKIPVRSKGQRKWREPDENEQKKIYQEVYNNTPDIAYFPTLVFDFPKSVYLTDRGGAIHKFYRQVFQDILDYDGRGHTIEKDIVRRVRGKEMVLPWLSFMSLWTQHDDRAKIQHVIDRASSVVTKLVFGRWNQIFGEDTKGKEVNISYDVAEGEVEDSNGNKVKTESHDVSIRFQIRDGTRRFFVNDRSLGFRWFFSFMLFTQFRVARSNSRPILFLFDEPAANLHAAAQQKLIESFPEIAKGEHVLAYTTHSHYMVEPKWLEQTFIVTNRSDSPSTSVLDEISLDDESLDIQATTYRSFVNVHPTKTSYFQPILDRLEVVPSRFDLDKTAIIVEGKSDYFILRYAAKLLKFPEIPLMPALGAGTFGALAAMNVAWNLEFFFLLDGDSQGKIEQKRYIKEFGIPENSVITLSQLSDTCETIEDIVDSEAIEIIKSNLNLKAKPDKSYIRRFFQERLASDNILELGSGFSSSAKILLDRLQSRISNSD